jgi:hypothetical protein
MTFSLSLSNLDVRIMVSVELLQNKCLNVVATMAGMELIVQCHWKRTVKMEKTMTKVNFAIFSFGE